MAEETRTGMDVHLPELHGDIPRTECDLQPVESEGSIPLPNGSRLYWKFDPAVSCREYVTDEAGGGALVWNTAIIDSSTLIAAIVCEQTLCTREQEITRRAMRDSRVDAAAIVGSLANGMSFAEVAAEYGKSDAEIREALRVALRRAANWEAMVNVSEDGPSTIP